jgi:glutathione S-transferase
VDLELVGYALCPFVHRAKIVVQHTQLPCKITEIPAGPVPDWLRAISPSGRVPLLRVDGTATIFESSVINEYLNEISGGALLPPDALARAINRSWIEFGTGALNDLYSLMRARSAMPFDAAIGGMRAKFTLLDQALGELQGPFFNGMAVSLVDFDYAPIFVRSRDIGLDALLFAHGAFPHVKRWSETVCSIPAVEATVGEQFTNQLRESIRSTARHAAKQLGLA